MADDVRKTYKQAYGDALNPTRTEKPQPISEKQMQLWQAVNDYCREQGAWVVSVLGHRTLRIECVKDSALPVKLKDKLGYTVHHAGVHTRIDGGKFLPVDIIEIEIGAH